MTRQNTIQIVDSTLREGEQFGPACFSSEDRLQIARCLDAFGVDYIEMTSPRASSSAAADLTRVAAMGLKAKVLTHTRCNRDDIQQALDCGVQGVQLLFGTSSLLRSHSHGRDLGRIRDEASDCIRFLRENQVEARFSCEDAFRTPIADVLSLYQDLEQAGVQRVGVADTVGIATPSEVFELVRQVRAAVACDIEFHGHNDTGCAVANADAALAAGASHIDVTVLGIGERNGITSLSGLIARLCIRQPEWLQGYDLKQLCELDRLLADILGMPVPFNACITSPYAFSHKAGLHTNAVLNEPSTYEVLEPERFGLRREVLVGHHLTGRHALQDRAQELGLELSLEELRRAAQCVSERAQGRTLPDSEVAQILRGVRARAGAGGGMPL